MTDNVVPLPTCSTCQSPMRLLLALRDADHGPVTRVLECARCRSKMVRHLKDREPKANRTAKPALPT
jgi:hypothetical protein